MKIDYLGHPEGIFLFFWGVLEQIQVIHLAHVSVVAFCPLIHDELRLHM
jgi:hypothetical protein